MIPRPHTFVLTLILLVLLVLPASAGYVWVNTTVDSDGTVGQFNSLAFNGSNPAISYFNGTPNFDLKYAYYDGSSWVNETVDTGGTDQFVGEDTSLAFNGSYPAISYYDHNNKVLKYAYYDGSSWDIDAVDTGNVGEYTSLAFNGGNPAISYYNGTSANAGLKYAWYEDSSWSTTTVDDTGSVGQYTSLAFNGSYPAISYFNATNQDLKYAWYDGSSWLNRTVDSDGLVGESTSLAFDGSGYPAISYWDNSGALKYAHYEDSDWVIETVGGTGSVGMYTSLAFNESTNTPAISYQNFANKDLMYAYYEDSDWVIETVDSGGDDNVGEYPSLVFNGIYPAISYWDTTNSALKYASYVPTGSISVSSDPADAWIWRNSVNASEQTDTTLTDIAPGTYNITVTLDGYQPGINTSVVVASGETTSVSFDLTAIIGSISVSSVPAGAWIWLDGVNASEQTDTTLTGIPVGEHNVTVQKALYATPANTTVTVTDGGTNSTNFILAPLPPVAAFSGTPHSGKTPLTVSFTNASTGYNISSWSWNFGDGATSTVQNPEHTYTNQGTYTVTLTVENEAGTDTKVVNGFIKAIYDDPNSGDDGDEKPVVSAAAGRTLLTSSEGKVLRDTTFISDDSIAALTFPQGTVALNGNGAPLKEIMIETINTSALPPLPDSPMFSYAGYAYTCSPPGATFAPPITLTFTLSEDAWNALNGDFSVQFYDEEAGAWIDIPVTVDPASHTVTAEVSHFSVFALFEEELAEKSTPVVAEETAAPTVALPSSTTTDTPPAPTPASPLMVIPMIALGALALLKKRQ